MEQINKPTRIIKEPWFEKRAGQRPSRRFKCDNGRTYWLEDLAAEINISDRGLYSRIKTHGWRSKEILVPVVYDGDAHPSVNRGNAEWRALGDEDRTRVGELDHCGSWESAQFVLPPAADDWVLEW